jgi:hypothetical protein
VRAEKAKRQDRIELAKKGIAETEPKISRLTISVPPASRVNGLEVRLDGSAVDAGAWGSAVPLDPGAHKVEASAPGFQAWSATVTLGAIADSKSLEVPRLTEEPKPAPTSSPVTTAASSTTTTPARDVSQQPPSPVPAYVAIGAGVLFIGGGVFAYTRAKSAKDDYFADCSNQTLLTCDNDAGRSKVRSWETISYVSLGVGVVAAGIGVVLLTTGGDDKRTATAVRAAPMVAVSGGGLTLSGAF